MNPQTFWRDENGGEHIAWELVVGVIVVGLGDSLTAIAADGSRPLTGIANELS
jgi:hypothetical protein